MTFVLDAMNLTLEAKEYTALEGLTCVAQLHPWDVAERRSVGTRRQGEQVVAAGVALETLILGEPLLRKYYTVFDAERERVGFGVGEDSDEIILMQSSMSKEL